MESISANSVLRQKFTKLCGDRSWKLYMPDLCLCGDNAAMVGAQGYYEYTAGKRADLNLNAKATMPIDTDF